MKSWTTAAAAGLLLLAFAACKREPPAGREPPPALEEPAAPASSPPTGTDEAAAPEPAPAVIVPEPLALLSVSPETGAATGGDEVAITGQGFAAYPRIAFGGVPAWIRSVTPTEIRVTAPPTTTPVASGKTLVVDVTVTNPPEGSGPAPSATLAQAYAYLHAAGSVAAEAIRKPPPAATESAPAAAAATDDTASTTEDAAPEPSLVADFSFDATPASEQCPLPSTNILFAERSTGGATEWRWDFGDGDASDQRRPEHCYTVPGMRSVTLTVRNVEASASVSKIVIAGME